MTVLRYERVILPIYTFWFIKRSLRKPVEAAKY